MERNAEQDQIADSVRDAAGRAVSLDAEVEAAGEATLEGEAVAAARAVLHDWVDTVVAVVSSPGVGRVTLIHANGRRSSIGSPDLPFALSSPARKGG